MNSTVYCDGIGAFSMSEGVVRLELVCLTQGADRKATPQPAGTLAMSLPGFVRAYQDMEKIINKMIADGVLQKNPSGTSVNEAAASSKKS